MPPARAQPGVLDDLAALGPFFAVDAHRQGTEPASPWRPFIDLTRPSTLRERIGVVRGALAAQTGCSASGIELRVAASVTHLGLVARLIAPILAARAGRHQLDMRPGSLWWQDTVGGPVPLSVPDPPAEAHGLRLIDEMIVPVTTVTAALGRVPPRVLWGNVASAVNGAASQVAAARPGLAAAAWDTAVTFFHHPRLSTEHGPPGPSFRRSSCCLIYRLTPEQPSPVCGDCILGKRSRRTCHRP